MHRELSGALLTTSLLAERSVVIPMATSALKKTDQKVTYFIKPGSSPNPATAPVGPKKYALISAIYKGELGAMGKEKLMK